MGQEGAERSGGILQRVCVTGEGRGETLSCAEAGRGCGAVLGHLYRSSQLPPGLP